MFKRLFMCALVAALVRGADHWLLHDRYTNQVLARVNQVTDRIKAAMEGKPPPAAPASDTRPPAAAPLPRAAAQRKATVTPEQLAKTKEQLKQEIAIVNPHVIHLAGGKVLEGTVESEEGAYVTIRQQVGSSGWFSRKVPRQQVVSVETAAQESTEITDEDVLIKTEFPTFRLVKNGPVSFFTDQDSLSIKDLTGMLERLRGQLQHGFGALAQQRGPMPAYVIVFSTEAMYRHYIQGMPSHAQNSVGLFLPSLNRLVVFNFFGSGVYQAVDAGLQAAGRDLQQQREEVSQSPAKGQADTRHYVEQLDAARQIVGSVGARVGLAAKAMNFMVIRHEGTHQFFHALGLDERPMGRQLWLLEGLATYAETPSVGDRANEQRLPVIKDLVSRHAHRQLRELIQRDDLFTSGDEAQGLAGYAESWSLVYYLMRSGHHDRFLNYLAAILALPAHERGEASPEERLAFFERHLGVSVTELEAQWAAFIRTL